MRKDEEKSDERKVKGMEEDVEKSLPVYNLGASWSREKRKK